MNWGVGAAAEHQRAEDALREKADAEERAAYEGELTRNVTAYALTAQKAAEAEVPAPPHPTLRVYACAPPSGLPLPLLLHPAHAPRKPP